MGLVIVRALYIFGFLFVGFSAVERLDASPISHHCQTVLGGISKPIKAYNERLRKSRLPRNEKSWKRVYQVAQKNLDVDTAAMSLMMLLALKLFYVKDPLEYRSYQNDVRILMNYGPVPKSNTRLRLISGLRSLGSSLKMGIWSMGPFLVRAALPDRKQKKEPPKALDFNSLDPLAFADRVELLNDDFFRAALTRFHELQSGRDETMARARKKDKFFRKFHRFFPTLMGAGIFFFGGHGMMPIEASPGIQRPDHDLGYPALQMFAEAAKQDRSFDPRGKKISYIVDANLIRDARSWGEPPISPTRSQDIGLVLPEVLFLSQIASQFNLSLVHDPKQFVQAIDAAQDSDLVVINGHGLPGYLSMGGRDLKFAMSLLDGKHLKPKTRILWKSCHFGDECPGTSGKEPFEIYTDQLIPSKDGRSVAPINNVSFYPIPLERDQAPLSPYAPLNDSDLSFKIRMGARDFFATGSGIFLPSMIPTLSQTIYAQYLGNETAWGNIAGFRIYDSASHSDQLIKVSSEQSIPVKRSLAPILDLYSSGYDEKERALFLKVWAKRFYLKHF